MLSAKRREVPLRMKRDQMNPSLERWHRAASEAKQKQSTDPRGCNDHTDAPQVTPFFSHSRQLHRPLVHGDTFPLGCGSIIVASDYSALSGLGSLDSTGPQGVALGYNMVPFQGSVQENIQRGSGYRQRRDWPRATPWEHRPAQPPKALPARVRAQASERAHGTELASARRPPERPG